MFRMIVATAAILLSCAGITLGQSIEIRYTDQPIKIDGIAEDIWFEADSAYDFQQYFPRNSCITLKVNIL